MALESILEPKPLPPPRPWGKIVLRTLIVLIVTGALYFQFRNYGEETEVKRFFSALSQSDYRAAYQVWKPASSYTFANFMEDWGPGGPWGRIQTFRIEKTRRKGESVVVTVRVNDRAETADIWVSRKDRSLSFPPF